jgi:hypothetical protein
MRILQPEYRERAIAAEIESTNAMGRVPVVLALLPSRYVATTPSPGKEALLKAMFGAWRDSLDLR